MNQSNNELLKYSSLRHIQQMISSHVAVCTLLYISFNMQHPCVILKYFATVMFCQGRSKLCSQGQENPFKLCLRDKSQNGIKPLLTNADVTPNKALRDNRAPALRCATQENSRLWEMAGWLLCQWGLRLSYQQRDLIASQTSVSLLSDVLLSSPVLSSTPFSFPLLYPTPSCAAPPSCPALSFTSHLMLTRPLAPQLIPRNSPNQQWTCLLCQSLTEPPLWCRAGILSKKLF